MCERRRCRPLAPASRSTSRSTMTARPPPAPTSSRGCSSPTPMAAPRVNWSRPFRHRASKLPPRLRRRPGPGSIWPRRACGGRHRTRRPTAIAPSPRCARAAALPTHMRRRSASARSPTTPVPAVWSSMVRSCRCKAPTITMTSAPLDRLSTAAPPNASWRCCATWAAMPCACRTIRRRRACSTWPTPWAFWSSTKFSTSGTARRRRSTST